MTRWRTMRRVLASGCVRERGGGGAVDALA